MANHLENITSGVNNIDSLDDFERSLEGQTLQQLKLRKAHVSQQLNSIRYTIWGWAGSVISGGVISIIVEQIWHGPFLNAMSLEAVLLFYLARSSTGAILGACIYGFTKSIFKYYRSSQLRLIEYELVKRGFEELQQTIEDNFFTKLVQINFKYIEQYYLQTQEQADKSFRLAAFASVTGLAIIVTGILMMLSHLTDPAYVTTSAGLLSEFIAAVFFYLYNRTILKMSQYHQKLVITQNISLALKITDDMEGESKKKALEMIIDRLTTDINKYLTEQKN